ncbi:hypothetical protein NECAME_06102 [Necator americanus]|uniref:Saposin B-type domain-containing protein n=1 Tax=Necator americanus TaxID=51031 RepID=W2TYC7_NECAM|nr:hypothetical protein NECAME_06102 [Necator americanus]ETN86027.1 hypothetical protein NECAME_06102 [Necator americanus]
MPVSAPLRVLAFFLLIRMVQQCSKSNSQHQLPLRTRPVGAALCVSCKDFLNEIKLGVPKKLDILVDRTRKAGKFLFGNLFF